MKSYVPVIAIAVTCVSLTACGSAPHGLDGTSWTLSGWTLSSLNPADFTITATFSDGKISGRSAVNHYSGSYKAGSDGTFSVDQIAMTQMAGPEPAMRAEQAYLTLLQHARSYSVVGRKLTLFDANGNESLIFERAAELK